MKCGFYLKRAFIIDELPNRLRKPRDYAGRWLHR
jgi:hypothetical protein